MNFLLDTHIWLWLQTEPERIGTDLLARLRVADSLLLSAASVWEMSIKAALGKLPLPLPASRYVPERMRTSGTEGLPIQLLHTAVAGELPLHHRDPFDRLLVAQSQILDIPLVTSDEKLGDYDAEIIWA